jgi:hypothetical protein
VVVVLLVVLLAVLALEVGVVAAVLVEGEKDEELLLLGALWFWFLYLSEVSESEFPAEVSVKYPCVI